MVNVALASDIVKGYITRLTRNYMSHAIFATLLFLFLPIQLLSFHSLFRMCLLSSLGQAVLLQISTVPSIK